ncbi:hypothetical protein [Priestia flexa]|uniref:hypothetical protein n=1 Tax=Priestia flexa TaxID=86664 RepID=UPI001F4CBD21|nr:hypothetical protein [Priestia flexa]
MNEDIQFIEWTNVVEWGKIFCPMLDMEVMTYYPSGQPAYDSYTAIIVGEDGETFYYRFDQDEGRWDEDAYWVDIEVEEDV